MTRDPVKQAWQASVAFAGGPPFDEVRKGADKFYRFVKWRNRVEYAACVVAVAIFSAYIFVLPHVLHKVGSALVVLATFYVAWQLHRRASAVAPEEAGARPILVFARAQLVRHRDALRSIFWWYIGPFLPGIALIIVGSGLDAQVEGQGPPIWVRWLALAGMAAILVGIWWLNQLAARKLQTRIDEIDALMGGCQ